MWSIRGKTPRRVAWVLGLGLVVAVRFVLEPRRGTPRVVHLSAQERGAAADALSETALTRLELVHAASRRFLLVGESHFYEEPQAFLEQLLVELRAQDGRLAVLLLELPSDLQPAINAYVTSGDEGLLAVAWRSREALPYQRLVRWARQHPEIVRRVVAYDEPAARIVLMRLLLTDTRNTTMAAAMKAAADEAPEDRVVAFGGRLHMMRAGRYLYDSPSRAPVGARLLALGVPSEELATLWIFTGSSPGGGVWSVPRAVRFQGAAGDLPIELLEPEPVFGARSLGEVVDLGVYLGAAKRISRL